MESGVTKIEEQGGGNNARYSLAGRMRPVTRNNAYFMSRDTRRRHKGLDDYAARRG